MNVLEMDFFRSLARQEVVLAGILSKYPGMLSSSGPGPGHVKVRRGSGRSGKSLTYGL